MSVLLLVQSGSSRSGAPWGPAPGNEPLARASIRDPGARRTRGPRQTLVGVQRTDPAPACDVPQPPARVGPFPNCAAAQRTRRTRRLLAKPAWPPRVSAPGRWLSLVQLLRLLTPSRR